jgi:hypothetical protein
MPEMNKKKTLQLVVLLLGVSYLCCGCASFQQGVGRAFTTKVISEANEKRTDKLGAGFGYLTPNGTLYVDTSGEPNAEPNKHGSSHYTIKVTLTKSLRALREGQDRVILSRGVIRPAEELAQLMEAERVVENQIVTYRTLASMPIRSISTKECAHLDHEVSRFLSSGDTQRYEHALFWVKTSYPVTFEYVSRPALRNGKHNVTFQIKKCRSRKPLLLLTPFTVVADVVTWPIQWLAHRRLMEALNH